MVNVLLVEDNFDTLEQWTVLFKTFLPDSQVFTATTADECRHIINEMKQRQHVMDIVVLDAMIPDSERSCPAVDPLLASNIGVAFPNSLIIHCTAFSADSDVKKRLESELRQLDRGRHFLVDKNSTDELYTETVERLSMRHLFEPSIFQRMTLLFGPAPKDVRKVGGDFSGIGGGYHVTRELSALMTDIRLSWSCLSENYRSWIKEHLSITEGNGNQVLISLLPATVGSESPDMSEKPVVKSNECNV